MSVTRHRRRPLGHSWWRSILWLSVVMSTVAMVFCSWTGTHIAWLRRRHFPGNQSDGAFTALGCRHVYRMSSVAYRQERAWPAVDGCVTPLLTRPMLRRCVEERARRRRRPTNVLLLGDSRLRLLFRQLAEELGVSTPSVETKPRDGWKKGIRVDNSPERWCRLCPWHCCPRVATGGGVSLQFLWRPFWTEAMVDALEAAAVRCERGQHDCPDLVIVNAAMWYGVIVTGSDGQTQMALLLRSQLAQAAAALARLARLTRTVWKLDEGLSYGFMTAVHRAGVAQLPVIHSLVYDVARKIPELVVWTSTLPEATAFLRLVCRPLLNMVHTEFVDTFYHHCGRDSLHPSGTIMLKFIHVLFAEVCSGYAEMASTVEFGNENRTALPATCCSENDPAIAK